MLGAFILTIHYAKDMKACTKHYQSEIETVNKISQRQLLMFFAGLNVEKSICLTFEEFRFMVSEHDISI